MDEERPLSDSSFAQPASERLDSWKQIASYLRRDIRTVQRWEEEEALPVHRHQHNRQASVYAFKAELDLWRSERQPSDRTGLEDNGAQRVNGNGASEFAISNEIPQRGNGRSVPGDDLVSRHAESIGAPESGFLHRLPLGRRAGLALIFLGLLGASSFALLRKSRHFGLESVSFQNNKLVAANLQNRVAWTSEIPFQAVGLMNSVMIPDSGADRGALGVAGLFSTGPKTSDKLCYFSAQGKLLWQFDSKDNFLFGPENFAPPWRGLALHEFTLAGQPRIAVSLQHYMWWPSMLVLFDLEGHPLGKFVNSGWIRRIQSLERPQGTLLVVTGVNNAFDGKMLAVLDAHQVSGSSPSPPGSVYECTSCPPGRPLKYFVFPRSELNVVTASSISEAGMLNLEGEIVAITYESENANSKVWTEGMYRFSQDFQLLSASYDDRYWEQHRQLELQGKIHHTKAKCPERSGPRLVRMWDPVHGWTDLHPIQK